MAGALCGDDHRFGDTLLNGCSNSSEVSHYSQGAGADGSSSSNGGEPGSAKKLLVNFDTLSYAVQVRFARPNN